MNGIDTETILLIVALTTAVVEGIKQAAGIGDNPTLKIVVSVVVGGILAAVSLYAPEYFADVVFILSAGLASAGLYSIGKRGGAAIFSK